MKSYPLTKRQRELLDIITEFMADNRHAPSFEEMAESLGVTSLATVSKHVDALEAKHYIEREYCSSRSIRLLTYCPTCGRENDARIDGAMFNIREGANARLANKIPRLKPLRCRHLPTLTNEEMWDFWGSVDMLSENECWLWNGSLDSSGYGRVYIRGAIRLLQSPSAVSGNGG